MNPCVAAPMVDHEKLVRRAPVRPLVWLGDRREPDVAHALGERFPAYPAKEKDFLDPPRRRS